MVRPVILSPASSPVYNRTIMSAWIIILLFNARPGPAIIQDVDVIIYTLIILCERTSFAVLQFVI